MNYLDVYIGDMEFLIFGIYHMRHSYCVKKLFLTDLAELPQFIRFDDVELSYRYTRKPIAEKCELIRNYLRPLKKALNNSKLISFNGIIKENDQNCFSDHCQLLEHLQNELLPICDSSRGYAFNVTFCSDKNYIRYVFTQILSYQAIDSCSTLEIGLFAIANLPIPIQLPIEDISKWLHRKCNGMNKTEASNDRFFCIRLGNMENIRELCDHMKEASRLQFFRQNLTKFCNRKNLDIERS